MVPTTTTTTNNSPNGGLLKPAAVVNQPTYLERGRLKFLIMDAPHYDNVGRYVHMLKQRKCSDLVRTCEKTYDECALIQAGITPHSLVFPDGDPPPRPIIREWLDLVETVCLENNSVIAVHCLAGLGRAPVLVVIALIEIGGLSNVDAIELVRSKRRGAINKRQLDCLIAYRKTRRRGKCCGCGPF